MKGYLAVRIVEARYFQMIIRRDDVAADGIENVRLVR